ncbi:ankyrin [Melanomma pulvis-pyrius CBS 109.77]|uniref:Ankyrin n=1 Tax=Melanomma pulvis-pyrius CBS 109.77 TaxID=1314802 RepID=A0A6A6WZ34_9PLEO|nr:ankyrin [Melanomma pulvis-pyrius CBS 109.77]
MLVDSGAAVNHLHQTEVPPSTPLHRAVKHPYGSKEFVHFLIENGSNVNALDSEGCTPLFWALRGRYSMRSRFPNNNEIIHELVTSGSTVTAIDEDGDTPLHDVPNVKIAKMFLQHGADALAKNKDGNTPIHTASAHGDMDVVKFLLEHGAYLDEADAIGQTPLMLDAGSDLDLLRRLLDRGASVNARTDAGWTSLYHAIQWL